MLINDHKYVYVQSLYKVINISYGYMLQVHIYVLRTLLHKVDETVYL